MNPLRASVVLCLAVAACASTPKTAGERRDLESRAEATTSEMTAKDPALHDVLTSSYAYVVFPQIGKGGAIVGGAHGTGILYERGVPIGFVVLNQASIGAQLGGQAFSELLVFRDRNATERLKSGNFQLGADVGAVALTAGAAARAQFSNGVAAFVMPRGGLMVDISVSGQKLTYQPMSV